MPIDFASAAQRFCAVIEEGGPSSDRLWLLKVETALADLYASAIALPETEPVDDVSPAWLSSSEWAEVFEHILARLGDKDAHSVVHPDGVASTFRASIADDLTSIYREVGAGLRVSRSGAAPEDVLFGWRSAFDVQWRQHALSALDALRWINGQ